MDSVNLNEEDAYNPKKLIWRTGTIGRELSSNVIVTTVSTLHMYGHQTIRSQITFCFRISNFG